MTEFHLHLVQNSAEVEGKCDIIYIKYLTVLLVK